MYTIQDQAQASTSTSSPSMLPPSGPPSYRSDQHQQHHTPEQFSYAYGSPYPQAPPSVPPPNAPSYDYAYSRPQHDMQSTVPLSMDMMSTSYTQEPSWDSQYSGGSGSTSHDRSTNRIPAWELEGGLYGNMGMQAGTSGHLEEDINGNGNGTGLGVGGESWRRDGPGWAGDYGKPAGLGMVMGMERELENLRYILNDLVEDIRPYAKSATNPNPPRPPPYAQQRFVRLAATIQSTMSLLQPHMHPLLHPDFTLIPPVARPINGESISNNNINGFEGHGTSSSIKPLTAAEQEMEIIRKRRDMLIARAAHVQASSTNPQTSPYSVQNHSWRQPMSTSLSTQVQSQMGMGMGMAANTGLPQSSSYNSQLPTSWNQGEIYANGGGMYGSTPLSTSTSNNSGSPFAMPPFDGNGNGFGSPSMTSSRRSTMTEAFDASLARFSLDPTRIGHIELKEHTPNKKSAPEGGKCHGCSVTVTAEWRRGPDGPRSLCNACGLHYAKITRKRAQEEANVIAMQNARIEG